MLFEEVGEVAAGQVVGRAELELDLVVVGPFGIQLGIVSQAGQTPQGKAVLGAEQDQVHGVGFLGHHARPRSLVAGHVHRHQVRTHDLDGRSLQAPVIYPGST